jgi:hypothetical protein
MLNLIKKAGLALGMAALAGAAHAAGSGTGIEAGFTDVGNDLETLLSGAGGFLIVIISVAIGVIMLAVGRGWGQAVIAFAVALFLGYGVTAFTGIAGVTGTVELLAVETTATPQGNHV